MLVNTFKLGIAEVQIGVGLLPNSVDDLLHAAALLL